MNIENEFENLTEEFIDIFDSLSLPEQEKMIEHLSDVLLYWN